MAVPNIYNIVSREVKTPLVEGSTAALSLVARDGLAGGTLAANLLFTGAENTLTLAASAGTAKITGCDAVPTLSSDLVNLSYVKDLGIRAPVKVATTGSLAATYNNGTLGVGATLTGTIGLAAVDGYTLVVGDRVLIKNQILQHQNGIYTFTGNLPNFVFTRATDYDTVAEMMKCSFVLVQEGTTNARKGYEQSGTVTAVGTSNVVFSEISSSIGSAVDSAVASPVNGELLTYDGAANKWINKGLMVGQNKGSIVTYSGTGSASSFIFPAANGDVLSGNTAAPDGVVFQSPLTSLGDKTPVAGSVLVKSKTTTDMVPVVPGTDNMQVLRVNTAEAATGVEFSNVRLMLTDDINVYQCDVSYLFPLTPTPTAGISLTGAAGTLISLGSFFDNAIDQLENSSIGGCVLTGGVNNAGITFNTGFHQPGKPYHYALTYAVALKATPPPAVPLTNMIVIVEDLGLPSQLIQTNTATIVDFYDTVVMGGCIPMINTIFNTANHTYDVCIQVGDAGANPLLRLLSYTFSCRMAL